MPSISADIVTTVVYGTAATIIGVVTIYQSYMAWQLWREHHHTSGPSSQGMLGISSPLVSKKKLCLPLCTDVELALGSALVVRPEPLNTASTNVAPVHDINNLQPVANEVTVPTSSQQLGPSNSSITDLEPTETRNGSQAAGSPGIGSDAPFTLPLQPLQTPELDVVPIQDTVSPQAAAYPEDPSVVAYPASNPPDVPASSNTPVPSTDMS